MLVRGRLSQLKFSLCFSGVFFSFFAHLLNFVPQRTEDKTQTFIHTHTHTTLDCADAHSNGAIAVELESKARSRCTNTQKEASVLKASVGPGEQRSLFQTPELPHRYHSAQFCSDNSIVCLRQPGRLGRAGPSVGTQERRINTATYCFHLIVFSPSRCGTLFESAADRG